jgi:membrane-associated protease RseP (regulator of RpoE activity)
VLIIMPAFAIVNALIVLTARRALAPLLGRPEIRFFPWSDGPSDKSLGGLRVAVFAIVPFAICYFVAAAPFVAAFKIRGTPLSVDEIPSVVNVRPEMAAAAAGMRDGDRIVAFGDAPVSSWSEMAAAVRTRAGERVSVSVDRDGQRLVLTVDVSDDGLIGVEARDVFAPVSLGTALVRGSTLPVTVTIDLVHAYWKLAVDDVETELGGAVAIMRAVQGASSIAQPLYVVGTLNAWMGLPAALLFVFLCRPRRRNASPAVQ